MPDREKQSMDAVAGGEASESAAESRRAFLKKAGTAAVAAPAATLLLSAKAAKADAAPSGLGADT